MTLSRILLSAAVAALFLVGCGGSGSSSSSNSTSGLALKQKVAVAVENGFRASTESGSSGLGRTALARSGGTKYFDSYLEVWVHPDEENNNGEFFLDEELTQPAGSFRQTVDPVTQSTETITEVTAGPMEGFNSSLKYGFEDGVFVVRYVGGSPKTGPFSFTVTNKDGAPEFQTEYQDADGVKRVYRVKYNGDGSSVVEYNTATEFQYVLNYNADNSGTGTVTGNSSLLPATLAWNIEGAGKLTFADGTELEFTNFDFSF